MLPSEVFRPLFLLSEGRITRYTSQNINHRPLTIAPFVQRRTNIRQASLL